MGSVYFYRDTDLPFFELKICDTSDLSYKKHLHEEYSLGIVEQGESSFWYEGKKAGVFSGNIVFIPPNTLHACNPQEAANWIYKMLFVHSQWVQALLEGEGIHKVEFPIVEKMDGGRDRFMMARLIDDLKSDISPLEKETSIMCVFLRLLGGVKTLRKKENPAKERPGLKLIRDYLHSHFNEKVTLDQLEMLSGLNKFYIVRLFNASYNVPPHAYQTLLRINHAKRELRKNRRTVDIALEAGFFDQSHFIKVFKGYVGTTPDHYQKLL